VYQYYNIIIRNLNSRITSFFFFFIYSVDVTYAGTESQQKLRQTLHRFRLLRFSHMEQKYARSRTKFFGLPGMKREGKIFSTRKSISHRHPCRDFQNP
jgi:hypothetical protein